MRLSLAEYKRLYSKVRPRKSKTKKIKCKVESTGEATLALQLKGLQIEFQQEFKFCEQRKWKADFYLVGHMILIEIEGGIWSNGRHTRGTGYLGDMEKYNKAQDMGYRVFRFSTEQVKSGLAVREIERLVG